MAVVQEGWGQHIGVLWRGPGGHPTRTHGNPPLQHLLQRWGAGKRDLGGSAWVLWAVTWWFPRDISYRHRGGFPSPPRTAVPTCRAGGEDVL